MFEDILEKQKLKARRETKKLIKSGELKKLNCEVCGSDKSVAHHVDYYDYMNVKFLCPGCHLKEHERLYHKNSPKTECPKCGKIFRKKRKWQKYCSTDCRQPKKYKPEKGNCKECGDSYTKYRPWQKFCCPECRYYNWEKKNPRVRIEK